MVDRTNVNVFLVEVSARMDFWSARGAHIVFICPLNPTTQFTAWNMRYRSASVYGKDTPDDFAVESIEQAKSPFQYQTISLARLLVVAV